MLQKELHECQLSKQLISLLVRRCKTTSFERAPVCLRGSERVPSSEWVERPRSGAPRAASTSGWDLWQTTITAFPLMLLHAVCVFVVNPHRCPPPRQRAILSYLSPVKTRRIWRRTSFDASDSIGCRAPATGRPRCRPAWRPRARGNYIRAAAAAAAATPAAGSD